MLFLKIPGKPVGGDSSAKVRSMTAGLIKFQGQDHQLALSNTPWHEVNIEIPWIREILH